MLKRKLIGTLRGKKVWNYEFHKKQTKLPKGDEECQTKKK